jgi:hypothetical protein
MLADHPTVLELDHPCRIGATLGVVVALGAWSGPFLAAQLADGRWAHAIQPRRGVLLEMPLPPGMAPLQRGLMEVGYAKVSEWVDCAGGGEGMLRD